jgi:hypothetical protein
VNDLRMVRIPGSEYDSTQMFNPKSVEAPSVFKSVTDVLGGAVRKYVPPHLREAFSRTPATAEGIASVIGPSADIMDMKHYGAETMNDFRAGNYLGSLANFGMTGAALGMTALPGSVGGIDRAVKKVVPAKENPQTVLGNAKRIAELRAEANALRFGDSDYRMQPVPEGVDDLPLDTASRMKRAEEMGNTVDAYHGSPRDIKEFNSTLYGSSEGHYGAKAYFTSSVDDVNANYAGEGPDLTNRIQRTMEQSADDPDDYNILEYWTDRDLDVDDIADLTDGQIEEAQEGLARQYLGVENQGTVYPVKLRMENPVVVGGKNETFFDYNMEIDDAGDYVDESGQAIELIETTKQTLKDWGASDYDVDDVMTKISESLEDGLSAGEYEDIMRSNLIELYDDVSGEMASPGAVIADVYKSMGFDSIDMDAYQAFNERRGFGGVKMGEMSGIYPDTRHYITLSDNQARSRFAKFDPAKKDSANLLAGVGGAGLVGVGGTRMFSDQEQ